MASILFIHVYSNQITLFIHLAMTSPTYVNTLPTDQCDINNGGCDHICANGQCQCFTGYRLGSDGRSCNGESSICYDQQQCSMHSVGTSPDINIAVFIHMLCNYFMQI